MHKKIVRQSIWHLIILIVGSIFFLGYYSFRDAVFFWILIGISYQLKLLSFNFSGFLFLLQFLIKLALVLTNTKEERILDAAETVYERDGDVMTVEEFSVMYETLAVMTNSRVWYRSAKEDLGEEKQSNWSSWPNKMTIRNITARLIGYDDSVVKDYAWSKESDNLSEEEKKDMNEKIRKLFDEDKE